MLNYSDYILFQIIEQEKQFSRLIKNPINNNNPQNLIIISKEFDKRYKIKYNYEYANILIQDYLRNDNNSNSNINYEAFLRNRIQPNDLDLGKTKIFPEFYEVNDGNYKFIFFNDDISLIKSNVLNSIENINYNPNNPYPHQVFIGRECVLMIIIFANIKKKQEK